MSDKPMSDAEIICAFCEPKPTDTLPDTVRGTKWWRLSLKGYLARWIPKYLGLDALHEVEARLTDEQWDRYASLMMDPAGIRHTRFLLHATAGEKIKALAAVLRAEVKR